MHDLAGLTDYDVLVIGGGLAGLTSAYTAKTGRAGGGD